MVNLAAQGVVAVNLANQSGTEGNLGRSFKQEAERYAKVKPGFEVVSFDFHHECKGMRYDRSASAVWPPSLRDLNSSVSCLREHWQNSHAGLWGSLVAKMCIVRQNEHSN